MNKVGATQWTMGKLLTLILSVFLLVLVLYGTQTKGFGPLKESIEGKFNEVLILIGFRDDGSLSCDDPADEIIEGMAGKFYP